METENKVITKNKTVNNNLNKISSTNKTDNNTNNDNINNTDNTLNSENINQYNNVFIINNIVIRQQNYEYMIANFELYPKNKYAKGTAPIMTNDLTNYFVYSYISLIKQQIISFYEKKENKTFKYWIIFILSFLLTLPFVLFEFACLLDTIFSL